MTDAVPPELPEQLPSNLLVQSVERLKSRLKRLRFGPPVAYTYNPLDYAWDVAQAYYQTYGNGPKEVLFVGMNPGPFGMGQTGVPFGEITAVRDFLCLTGTITAPRKFHPKRPVEGFACKRSEVSGERLWGVFQRRYGTAEAFFAKAFVINYCPLLFLGPSGINLTPDKLQKEQRKKMEVVCDKSLKDTITILEPKYVIGIGNYAHKRAKKIAGDDVINMPHPSPANPKANRQWEKDARKALTKAGLPDLI